MKIKKKFNIYERCEGKVSTIDLKIVRDRFLDLFPGIEPTPEIDNYEVPISAFDLHWVSPDEIRYITGRPWKPWAHKTYLLGRVMGGDWDRDVPNPPDSAQLPKKYNDYFFHKSSVRHFQHGVPWEETTLYERMSASRGKVATRDALRKYDDLFEKIESEGYKIQSDLKNGKNDKRDRYVNEICVDRGRDGEYLFVDSRHRLSIAKILDLDRIPIAILVRHTEWVEKLERNQK